MNLRAKVILIFTPAVALIVITIFAVLDAHMMRGYEEIETQYAIERAMGVAGTFNQQLMLDLPRADWAAWDEVYNFVADGNKEFILANISGQSLADIGVNSVVIVNEVGRVVLARSYDLETKKQRPVSAYLLDALAPGAVLLDHPAGVASSHQFGIILTPDGAILAGSRPILKSTYQGPARGALIFARDLTQDQLDALGDQLRLSVQAFVLNDTAPPNIADLARSLPNPDANRGNHIHVMRENENEIVGYAHLHDINGDNGIVLATRLPRTFYQQARAARTNFAWSMFGIGAATIAVLVTVVELLIVSRLRRFSRDVARIRVSGDRGARVAQSGHDEVSSLAEGVNALMTTLDEAARKDLDREERFRLLTTHIPVGIFEANVHGDCLFVNDAWSGIAGMTLDQAIGDGWHSALHPEDHAWVRQRGGERVGNGEPFDFECRFLRPDGGVRHVLVNVVPVRDAHNTIIGSMGCIVDISERKRAEQELLASEKQYRGIIELQAELVCRYQPDTVLTYVNEAYCTYFGKEQHELVGKSFLEVIPSSQSLAEIIVELENSHGAITTRNEVVRPNGEVRWQEWEDTPIRAADGRIIEFQAIGRDITERKLAEDALRESEAKLRSITASVADAIIMMDEDGLVSFWNEAAERIFGYSRMEVLGRPLHDTIVPQRYRSAFARGHRHFLESGVGAVVGKTQEVQGLRKDGTEFPLELAITGVRFGEEWHAIGTARDITERKRSEQQLETSARAMEAANLQLEEAIGQANQLALEAQVASVAKSDFVANMSHEIRTPLNGVIGMTTLLLDTELNPEQREFAQMVRTSGEALLSVVNDILDFSKIEAGKMELESIEFNLRAAIEQIGDICAPRAQEKGIEFTILIHHGVPDFVKGDPGRIRQVLLNLASNALKFTERGEIVVSAELEARESSLAMLRFEVSDSGIGIAESRLPFLFQPFTQADSSTTRKYGGTGLGLTISKRLCEAMGGQIGVKSEVGKGSTFYFNLRAEIVQGPEKQAPLSLDALAGLRVLVVDGSATARKVYREQLRNWGVAVEEVTDTDAAYDKLRASATNAVPFAVALVDSAQPRTDAVAFAERVKEDPVVNRVRLILITSWPKRGDAAKMAKRGYAAYLSKPVKRDHLLEAIAAVATRYDKATGSIPGLVTQHTIMEAARQRVKILLVEDNLINQKVASRMLERLGCRCDIANNGREALEAVKRTEYNLIFMDCHMPEMDGYEATKAIRLYEGDRRYTPIVALTASVLRADHDFCIKAGMDAVMTKPLHADPLEKILRAFLSDDPPVQKNLSQPVSTFSSDTPVNLDRLGEITMGDPELEADLIITFLADTAQRISDLAELISSGDVRSIGRTAHALKGSAANMGARTLQDIAQNLEETGKTGDMAIASSAFGRLKTEADRVREYLSGYMQA
ncbi:MAG: PAS domain S-box protein [Candidatus Hydrogenedentes bacterium]|nr:PAS domain S-box protein [Candidatus Hydrogenedentota bacterium]